jgi:hypothetical protein
MINMAFTLFSSTPQEGNFSRKKGKNIAQISRS